MAESSITGNAEIPPSSKRATGAMKVAAEPVKNDAQGSVSENPKIPKKVWKKSIKTADLGEATFMGGGRLKKSWAENLLHLWVVDVSVEDTKLKKN